MSENMKSGMVLVGALLLGGLLVAGLLQQVGPGGGEERSPQVQPPAPPEPQAPPPPPVEAPIAGVAPAPSPADTPPPAVPEPPAAAAAVSAPAPVPPIQAVAEEVISLVPRAIAEVEREEAPTVDFFGKPLDAFGIEVNKRVGIAGQVVMAGRSVPGATVLLRRVSHKIADGAPDYTGVDADPSGGQEWSAVTDAEGKYAFYGLDDGHYGLVAYTDSACGAEDMTIREGSIPGRLPGKPAYFAARAHLSIELWPSGALNGLVLTPDGQPVAGATLYPYEIQSPTGSLKVEPIPQVLLSEKTGEDGAFHFRRLPAGRWQLALRAAGYPDQRTDWLSTGDLPAELRLNGQTSAAQTNDQKPENSALDLADYKDKYLLLDFWAVWCEPCRAEIPKLRAVYEEFKSDPRFAMVSASLDANPGDAKKYVAENGMGWTQVFLGDWNKTPVPKQYGVEGIPCAILFAPEAKEIGRNLHGQEIGDAIRKILGNRGQRGTDEKPKPAETATPTAPEAQPPAPTPASNTVSQGVLRLNLDVGFDYSSEGFPMGLSAGQTDAPLSTERPCKTLSKEPAYHSKVIWYGYLRLGNAEDNRFVFAIDESDKSPWYGYFDRNNNADLTDDGPPVIISANVEFDVAVVLPSGKTVHRPYKIWQWPNGNTGKPSLRFYSVCHHQARIPIYGKKITAVAFERFDHDALYHDDGIWLDLNGDNHLDEKTECFKDGSTVTVNGKAVRIALDYP